ncbi:hypothetical protein [Streptomyces sp. NPDC002763]|uniref:hypothetical protein n=1 Tax=Streptomyces sp. NPDC002763 TaxID=3154427 RepID=UPI00331B6C86
MVGTDVCQFLSSLGDVERGSDPRAGLVDQDQPPLQPPVAFLLVRHDGLLRGAIDVLETLRTQRDHRRADQFRVAGKTGCLVTDQLKQTGVAEPVAAQELVDGHTVPGEPTSNVDTSRQGLDLGHVETLLVEIQHSGDMCAHGRRRRGGEVLVFPQLRELAADKVHHRIDQLIRSRLEPSGNFGEEGLDVARHNRKYYPQCT